MTRLGLNGAGTTLRVTNIVKVLITGMSGTGKSSVVEALSARGYRAIDLDGDEWSEWVPCMGDPTGARAGHDWLWRERKLAALLDETVDPALFVSGCASNMGRFTRHFSHIVLLSGPLEVLLERVRLRDTNPYGKIPGEAAQIEANLREFEPRLRAIATGEVSIDQPLESVVDAVLRMTCAPGA